MGRDRDVNGARSVRGRGHEVEAKAEAETETEAEAKCMRPTLNATRPRPEWINNKMRMLMTETQ